MEKVIIKRDGSIVEYNQDKILNAISKANQTVSENNRIDIDKMSEIVKMVDERFNILAEEFGRGELSVEEVQDIVEQGLFKYGNITLFTKYHDYRAAHKITRNIKEKSALDKTIIGLVRGEEEENPNRFQTSDIEVENTVSYVKAENSNKNADTAATQRDLIAGEVSRDLTKRVLLPEDISKAHEKGWIHFHDADYFLQPIFNCCLINIGDMLDNGTVMNGKLIESPKNFQVACTVMTQIIASVASNQYGGQSVDTIHLGKYLRKSKEKYWREAQELHGDKLQNPEYYAIVEKDINCRIKDELKSGVQTIQYQINTLMTTNGQSPFVTLFMHLDTQDEYIEENAAIIMEILRQRYEGIKNEKGVYITPAFPKLVYVLDECNNLTGGKYDYITEMAVKCTAKRMYPDYISAKKMRENYEGNIFGPMGCRSFLSPWKDENGNYKFEGRFNQGVVSLNLPGVALEATREIRDYKDQGRMISDSMKHNAEMKFWQILDERLSICYKALMERHKALLGTLSDVSPIHWQDGAIARLKKGEKIDKYLMGGYSTLSLGYIGLYEATKLMTGESHTSKDGEAFALKLMNYLRGATDRWKATTGLGFALYGTPAESLCYRFARIDAKTYGDVPDITDKGYYTNSYHVDVREHITAFDKFTFESQFQPISSGGCISYAEIPNMQKNLEALKALVRFIYDNIQYAEFNTKSDYCMNCGFDGEIIINDDNEWECPNCGNKDHKLMSVTRRTCGYLGENFWNYGKTLEIKQRVLHV